MKVRRFKPNDSDFCFKIRCDAFIIKFYDEIGPHAVAAGINAYLPQDYVELSKITEFFIVESESQRVGFFTLKRVNQNTAEIPLIYFDLSLTGKGLGSSCMKYIEHWIQTEWKNVTNLYLDTIIPKYNGGFYRKLGFEETTKTYCQFNDLRIPALRFEKIL